MNKRIIPRFSILKIVLLVFLCSFSDVQAEIFIIANRSVPVNDIKLQEIREIYLGFKTNWNDLLQVKPVVLSAEPLHSEFLSEYTNKTKSQYKYYWRNIVFTGKGFLPKFGKTEEAVILIVSQTRGAIGFVSFEVNTEDVKTLLIMK